MSTCRSYERNTCRSCKYWELNRSLALNGIEHTSQFDAAVPTVSGSTWEARCENDGIRDAIRVWEVNLPSYITPQLRKEFIANYQFGCANWKEADGWEALWE